MRSKGKSREGRTQLQGLFENFQSQKLRLIRNYYSEQNFWVTTRKKRALEEVSLVFIELTERSALLFVGDKIVFFPNI